MLQLWQWDQMAFKSIHVGLHRDWLDSLMKALSFSGLGYAQAIWFLAAIFLGRFPKGLGFGVALGVTVAIGFAEKSVLASAATLLGFALFATQKRAVAFCALASIVSSGIIRVVFAEIIDRQRPSNFSYALPLENIFGGRSFPSGHTTTTFAIFAVIVWALQKREDGWFICTVCLWACLVGLSRVYVGVHYPLDVLGGAVLGFAVGSLCYWIWCQKGWLEQAQESSEVSSES